MFNLIYIGSFLVIILGLILWTRFNAKKADRFFRAITLTAVLAYFGSWLVQVAPIDYKLEVIIRDLVVIAASGAAFSYVARKTKLFVFLLIVTVAGGYWYYKNVLEQSFPYVAQNAAVKLEASGELFAELMHGLNDKEMKELNKWAEKRSITISTAFDVPVDDQNITDLDDYILINTPEGADLLKIKKELNKFSFIEWVEENESISVAPMPATETQKRKINPLYGIDDPGLDQLWSFKQMKMDKLYDYLESNKIKPKKKAIVAILDTGVDAKHEDIKDNFTSFQKKSDNDPRGHGTHCAGIAGAVSNNGVGVASYSRSNEYVSISSIKVLNSMGFGNQRMIIDGIIKAADKGADVISMSLGGPSNDSRQKAYSEAVAYANKKGAIVIAAAGNSSANAKNYSPVNAKGMIGVSAVDADLNKASFSNTVNDLKMGIAAPGVAIYSTIPDNKYATYNGTSMATPYVSGLVGLMRSIKPDLTTEEVFKILNKTGVKTGNTKETGRFIQPHEAVKAIQ